MIHKNLFFPFIFLFCFSFLSIHCFRKSLDEKEYQKALVFLKTGEFNKALDSFSHVMQMSKGRPLSLLAARQAAEVSLYKVKDYKQAIDFFKFLVLFSSNREDALKAQESIGETYFEKLNDYGKAIETFTHLLSFAREEEKKNSYRIIYCSILLLFKAF